MTFAVIGGAASAGRARFDRALADAHQRAGRPVARVLPLGDAVADDAVLSTCHAVVVTEPLGALPQVVVRALAKGRAVLAADGMAAQLVVDAGVNGWLIQDGDGPGWADAVEAALRYPELLVSMGRASRLKAERRFDVQAANAEFMMALGLADLHTTQS